MLLVYLTYIIIYKELFVFICFTTLFIAVIFCIMLIFKYRLYIPILNRFPMVIERSVAQRCAELVEVSLPKCRNKGKIFRSWLYFDKAQHKY